MTEPNQPVHGPRRVLFVCMGNICRSPLAEGVFLHLAAKRGLTGHVEADSCGTGDWHAGELPDRRARAVAERHGIRLTHRARVLVPASDFCRFDLLLTMDQQNLGHVLRRGGPAEKCRLLRSYVQGLAEHDLEVPDPYYGSDDGFQTVFDMLMVSCSALLDHIEQSRLR